jgi:sugar lactone lactonase YvrE
MGKHHWAGLLSIERSSINMRHTMPRRGRDLGTSVTVILFAAALAGAGSASAGAAIPARAAATNSQGTPGFVSTLSRGHRYGVANPSETASMSVLASGLAQPKEIAIGPDGNLYVACSGNASPADPPAGGTPTNQSGAVVRISRSGTVTPFLTGLRSQFYEGSSVGPSGLAFWGGSLYVAQALHDTYNSPTGQLLSAPVLKVSLSGHTRTFTSFNALPFDQTTTSALDTDPYAATVGADGLLYVSDGGDNGIWQVQPNGDSTMLIQFPGNPVVTGITAVPSTPSASHSFTQAKPVGLIATLFGNGAGGFANGRVMKVTGAGASVLVPQGNITMPIGAAYSPSGRLYVLQFSQVNPNPGPPFVAGTGAIWSVSDSGAVTKVLGGLTFPTSITFDADGSAYVANNGLMPATGPVTGEVVKVTGLD